MIPIKKNYIFKKENRKSISIKIDDKLDIIIKYPILLKKEYVDDFIKKNQNWIDQTLSKKKERLEFEKNNKLSLLEIKAIKKELKTYIDERILYFSSITGFQPNNVKITQAKTRWGSCSGKNNICFSYRCHFLPIHLMDYIILHELVHIKIKNHGPNFYDEISKYMPEYKNFQLQLKNISDFIPI